MKIAVVGAGISGLVVAYLLAPEHDVTVFEQNEHAGGHSNTVDVTEGDRTLAVDTGFIVFNDWTYPNFQRLLRRLGVASRPTRMNFGFRDEVSGVEYAATTPRGFFAQPKNLLSLGFHRMLLEILRFRRAAAEILERDEDVTLGDYLERERYGRMFADCFIVPMGGAIWSAPEKTILGFPLSFFLRFLMNHGMLNAFDQPTWRVVSGGSRVYVEALTRSFRDRIRLHAPVSRVRRTPTHVEVASLGSEPERFDHLVLACHSDQALALLSDPSDSERSILGAIGYQTNEAVLHTDASLLPKNPRARAAWNLSRFCDPERPVAVTYYMNLLQHLESDMHYLVTLGRSSDIETKTILRRIRYEHPVYSREAVSAQQEHARISGIDRTHYAGAYWRYGFHEDGVLSALRVAERFGGRLA